MIEPQRFVFEDIQKIFNSTTTVNMGKLENTEY